jgi:hypothetical protein
MLIVLHSLHHGPESNSESVLKVVDNTLRLDLVLFQGVSLEIVGIEQIGDWDVHG